jgi:hypothetical protein
MRGPRPGSPSSRDLQRTDPKLLSETHSGRNKPLFETPIKTGKINQKGMDYFKTKGPFLATNRRLLPPVETNDRHQWSG